jgi:hypothetical protein
MKKILFFFAVTLLALSCSKDFGDTNVDTKKPAVVPPGSLFANAQKSLVDVMTSTNVNNNIFRMLAQQWTETTYIDEANYDLTTRNIPQNFWNTIFTGVLINLKETQRLIPAQNDAFFPAKVKANQNACAEILNVYAYATLVNTFGNMPYSQSLDYTVVYPEYDDAAAIYDDLLARLNKALTDIDVNEAGFDGNDLLYGGNMAGWKKFGSSLKLRLGMMLADVDAAKAKTIVESAAADAVTDNADNVVFAYLSSPPNTNPVWVDLIQSGRQDFVAANTLVDFMKDLADPRIPAYFTTDAAGGYSGGIYAANNSFVTYSKPSDAVSAPDYPSVLFDAAEGHFLLAEAVERGFNVGGTAAVHYEEGVRASIAAWGGSTAAADAYMLNANVAYATAPGDWKVKIGNQAWIALYNRGFDAWTEWRRLDAPTLNIPDGLTYADIPRRYTYPVQEQNLNVTNYERASTAIGGDAVTTKLFWDKF